MHEPDIRKPSPAQLRLKIDRRAYHSPEHGDMLVEALRDLTDRHRGRHHTAADAQACLAEISTGLASLSAGKQHSARVVVYILRAL